MNNQHKRKSIRFVVLSHSERQDHLYSTHNYSHEVKHFESIDPVIVLRKVGAERTPYVLQNFIQVELISNS
jgi:hypothetical protein